MGFLSRALSGRGCLQLLATAQKSVLLSLTAALLLCACGQTATEDTSSASSVTGADVPAEEAVAEPQQPAESDGLEGVYYNDYLRMTLTLDGTGGCALNGGGTEAAGTYERSAAGDTLTLRFDTRLETAAIDADGDICIEGRSGYFLRDWTFWGITWEEVSAVSSLPTATASAAGVSLGNGTVRYRDYENAVAFTCPESYSVLTGQLTGAVAVSDGAGGYVTGRNVTSLYFSSNHSDDELLEDYVKTFVFADFNLLYGGILSFDSFTLLHEEIEGRLAAATLNLVCASDGESVAVQIILYTSTYADGTVNYICKTVFVPASRADGAEQLAAAVTDMGAVRLSRETE